MWDTMDRKRDYDVMNIRSAFGRSGTYDLTKNNRRAYG
jgi:hypothetical protein